MSIAEHITAASQGYELYKPRLPEYDHGAVIPFRVSPEPLFLTAVDTAELNRIGSDVTDFVHAMHELYQDDSVVRTLLNTGKPEIFLAGTEPQYLFIRPDLIITPAGFRVCEIEMSPFGLALAEILNTAYTQANYETMVPPTTLGSFIQEHTPVSGTILYSQKTKSYSGQMAFLADHVFSTDERHWEAQQVSEQPYIENSSVYRAFYPAEYLSDPAVKQLLDTMPEHCIIPSLTPQFEEKALLAFLWDTRWKQQLIHLLGMATFNHLRNIVPQTWIVGQEHYFEPGLPNGISDSIDLATVSRSKRTLVLKSSGFSPTGSWGQGVTFLHRQSAAHTKELLRAAQQDVGLSIIQQFTKAQDFPLLYEDDSGNQPMTARIRLTPYYAMVGQDQGRMIAIKATGCQNTDYIHATSTSINTAVGQARD